jgi:hypothetical protein
MTRRLRYRAHHLECAALLRMMYGRKRSPAPILVFAGGAGGGGAGEDVGATAEDFTAKALLEWEQA